VNDNSGPDNYGVYCIGIFVNNIVPWW